MEPGEVERDGRLAARIAQLAVGLQAPDEQVFRAPQPAEGAQRVGPATLVARRRERGQAGHEAGPRLRQPSLGEVDQAEAVPIRATSPASASGSAR